MNLRVQKYCVLGADNSKDRGSIRNPDILTAKSDTKSLVQNCMIYLHEEIGYGRVWKISET